jgi:hypothetical protein
MSISQNARVTPARGTGNTWGAVFTTGWTRRRGTMWGRSSFTTLGR